MKTKTLLLTLAATLCATSISTQALGQIKFNGDYEAYPPKKTDATKIVTVDCGTQAMQFYFRHTDFINGIAFFLQPSNNLWGAIDTKGNIVIKPTEMLGRSNFFPYFVDGKAVVKSLKQGHEVVDYSGKIIATLPNLYKINGFVDGYTTAIFNDSKNVKTVGFIDPKGNIAFKSLTQTPKNSYYSLEEMRPFGNNLSAIKNVNSGLWGFFNREGKLVIPYTYAEVDNFNGGLAAVKLNDKWGYIDTTGKTAIDFKFSSRPGRFSHNRALVVRQSDDAICVIDAKGDILKVYENPSYSPDQTITSFCSNGLAVAFINNKHYTLVDTTFKQVSHLGTVPVAGYDSDRNGRYNPQPNGMVILRARAWANNFLLSKELSTIVVCPSIGDFKDGLSKVKFNETGFGYINEKGELVIEFARNEF